MQKIISIYTEELTLLVFLQNLLPPIAKRIADPAMIRIWVIENIDFRACLFSFDCGSVLAVMGTDIDLEFVFRIVLMFQNAFDGPSNDFLLIMSSNDNSDFMIIRRIFPVSSLKKKENKKKELRNKRNRNQNDRCHVDPKKNIEDNIQRHHISKLYVFFWEKANDFYFYLLYNSIYYSVICFFQSNNFFNYRFLEVLPFC